MKATRIPAVIETVERVVEPSKITLELSEDEALFLGGLLGMTRYGMGTSVGLDVSTSTMYQSILNVDRDFKTKVPDIYNKLINAGFSLRNSEDR